MWITIKKSVFVYIIVYKNKQNFCYILSNKADV